MTEGRIVLDARTASEHFPGIGRAVVGLARALADPPGEVDLTLVTDRHPDPRLPLDTVRVLCPGTSVFGIPQQFEMPRLLRRERAILYHSPYYLMPYRPGVPTVVTCWDLIPLRVPGLFDRTRRLAFEAAHRLAFRAADAIVVPSATTARDVADCFPAHASKIRIVPLGGEPLECDSQRSPGAAPDPIPAAEPPFILCVGSNKPHKNLRVVTEACALILARGGAVASGLRLVLAGPRDPRYDEGGAAGESLRRAGRLVSLGRVSDAVLGQLYRRAALFILPSKAEGFGFPALEAMTGGAPVICSRVAALEELCGDAARYFEPEDAEQLADTTSRLLESPAERERMRQAGFARARTFSWDRTGRDTFAVYNEILGRRA